MPVCSALLYLYVLCLIVLLSVFQIIYYQHYLFILLLETCLCVLFQRGSMREIPAERLFLQKATFLTDKTIILFKASDNISLSWGEEPTAYHLHASHSIRPPFNYKAGHKSVFPHHTPSTLRPSFNDEKSAPGGLDICFYYYSPSFYFLWVFFLFVMGVCVCVFFFHVFALRLEIWCPELECATSLFHTFSYGITCIHCGFTLNLSSFPSKAGALTKLVQREGEI